MRGSIVGVDGLAFGAARRASRFATYVIYGRNYRAPLSPTKLYRVSPNEIERIPVEKPSLPIPFITGVEDGDWDLETRRVRDDVVYRAFKQRFDEGADWEETDYHAFMQDRLRDTSTEWSGYETMDDVRRRYESLDRLYRAINRNGYVPQHELQPDQQISFPSLNGTPVPLPPEFREIAAYVSRDGEFMWAAGMHRLCIAKLAAVERIPVRIRIRHEAWQRHRDAVSRGDVPPGTHPDTRDLSGK